MRRSLFWLSGDGQAATERHFPKSRPGACRIDDKRAISGIIRMLNRCGRVAGGYWT